MRANNLKEIDVPCSTLTLAVSLSVPTVIRTGERM